MAEKEKSNKADHLKQFQWKKGQSGNPSGRPKGIPSLEAALRRRLEEADGADWMQALVEVAFKKATKGDHRFWNSILERLDGKVADRIAGADGEGLTVILERAGGKDESDGDGET